MPYFPLNMGYLYKQAWLLKYKRRIRKMEEIDYLEVVRKEVEITQNVRPHGRLIC